MLTSDTGPIEGHEHGIMLRLGNVYGGKEDIECEVRMNGRTTCGVTTPLLTWAPTGGSDVLQRSAGQEDAGWKAICTDRDY